MLINCKLLYPHSRNLKFKWAFMITCCLSSVYPTTCHIFDFFSRTTGQFHINLIKEIQVCTNDWLLSNPRGKNNKNMLTTFKNLLLDHCANFRLGTMKASLDKGDSCLFKWGAATFFSGRNCSSEHNLLIVILKSPIVRHI